MSENAQVSPITREGVEESERKIKKRPSLKFQGSKVSKTKVEQIETAEDLNKPNNTNDSITQKLYDHFEYRGTFGENHPEVTAKNQQQSTTKKVKKIKQRESSEEDAFHNDEASTEKQNK